MQFFIKTLISALLIATASELAKRMPWLGALIISLPFTSIFALIWLYHDTHDVIRIASFSHAIGWLVVPSLVLFIALPVLLRAGWSFWPSLTFACLSTIVAYGAMMVVLRRFGIAG